MRIIQFFSLFLATTCVYIVKQTPSITRVHANLLVTLIVSWMSGSDFANLRPLYFTHSLHTPVVYTKTRLDNFCNELSAIASLPVKWRDGCFFNMVISLSWHRWCWTSSFSGCSTPSSISYTFACIGERRYSICQSLRQLAQCVFLVDNRRVGIGTSKTRRTHLVRNLSDCHLAPFWVFAIFFLD